MRLSRRLAAGLALATVALVPSTAAAVENGPAPTASYLRSLIGPYGLNQQSYSDSQTGSGFGAATVYWPRASAGEKFGVIAFAPGWTENASAVDWIAKRVASFGFVTISFNVNNTFIDFPPARGNQLLAALDFATDSSAAKGAIDGSRQGVAGHSMGGGATLYASRTRPSLKAAVGLAAWSLDKNWGDIDTPNLQIGAQNDFIASPGSHQKRFYDSLPATTPKQFLELKGFGHLSTNYPSAQVAAPTIAWFKRFVDGDARYRSATCPTEIGVESGELSGSQSSC